MTSIILFATIFEVYNFLVLLFSVAPSVGYLLTNFEFRFSKGYNLVRLITSTLLIVCSLFCYCQFLSVVKTSEIDLILFLKCTPWLSGLIILVFFLRISQPFSLLEWFGMFRNKDFKDADLLEPKKVLDSSKSQTIVSYNYQNNINTFNTEFSIDNSTTETHINNSATNNNFQQSEKFSHPLLKNLVRNDLLLITKKFEGLISIDDSSTSRLYNLFEKGVFEKKIEITV